MPRQGAAPPYDKQSALRRVRNKMDNNIEKRIQGLTDRLTYARDIFAGKHEEDIRLLEEKLAVFVGRAQRGELADPYNDVVALEELFGFVEKRLENAVTPMDKVRIVRHPQRICLRDILENVYDNFTEVGGQDEHSLDPSMLIARAVITRRRGKKTYTQSVMVIGQEKGHGAEFRNGGSVENTDATVRNTSGYDYEWQNIITYNTTIADAHDITVTGVSTYNHNQSEEYQMYGENISDNKLLWYGLNSTSVTNRTDLASYEMSKGLGFVARLNYSYLGKYLFSASCRWDGSSRLADGNKWDYFPAVSAGWRMSDEKFMEGTRSWLDNLKWRVGWGITGTASIDPYSSASNLEESTLSFSGANHTIYRFSEMYTNRALGWEKSYNTNIGLDAAFLNNRIDVSMDYYFTKTKGVIWERQLPITNGGYNSSTRYKMNMNICETENRGFEMALNTRNIETKDFSWNSTVTFNYNKEEIKSLIDGAANNITNGDYSLTIGEPVNSFYNYKIDGMWQKGEEADAAVFNCAPGDIKINVPGLYKESDGVFYKIDEETGDRIYYNSENKYAYSDADYQVLGHNSPDWTLGFQNTFKYKNFDLSIFMYMRWGQMIKYGMLSSYDPRGIENFPTYFNYWTEDNPSNDFPAINATRERVSYVGFSALEYVDGSFFKIRNITLGYTLPENLLKKAGIGKCRFYATITNPLVVAKSHLLEDYDPEMNGGLNYPLTKQMVFGVNLSF